MLRHELLLLQGLLLKKKINSNASSASVLTHPLQCLSRLSVLFLGVLAREGPGFFFVLGYFSWHDERRCKLGLDWSDFLVVFGSVSLMFPEMMKDGG